MFQNREAMDELTRLERSVSSTKEIPEVKAQGFTILRRVQLLLFLHTWSILTRNFNSLVSAEFMTTFVRPLRDHHNWDLWLTVHRYCYLLWLHRHNADKWQSPSSTFLLPNTPDWQQWWVKEQEQAVLINEKSFCDEYMIFVAEPLGPNGQVAMKRELSAFGERINRSDLGIFPEVPDMPHCQDHDSYVDASEALPFPRALPFCRCSAAEVEAAWGNQDGHPREVTRENQVTEINSCLDCPIPIPQGMKLNHFLGSVDWFQSFLQSRLGTAWWAPGSAGASTGPANQDQTPQPTDIQVQIHFQALGAEIMQAIRPDNVFHPALRPHLELHLGMFASIHVQRNDLDRTDVHQFLWGCGIKTRRVASYQTSWVRDVHSKRETAPKSLAKRPMCHTLWGEKRRAQGFYVDNELEIYLVHEPCPQQPNCTNHQVLCGFGTLCNCWHGFNRRHSRALSLGAQRYLDYSQIGDKGKDKPEGINSYLREFLQEIGYCAPVGTYSEDGDDRLLLHGLPRWLPNMMDSKEAQKLSLVSWVRASRYRNFRVEDCTASTLLRERVGKLQQHTEEKSMSFAMR